MAYPSWVGHSYIAEFSRFYHFWKKSGPQQYSRIYSKLPHLFVGNLATDYFILTNRHLYEQIIYSQVVNKIKSLSFNQVHVALTARL